MIVSNTKESIARAAKMVAKGGVIAFRTDTLYGLGADPFNASAVAEIVKLKGREGNKPILVIISDPSHLRNLAAFTSKTFEKLAAKFWPGPLTLIVKAKVELPQPLTAGSGGIGLRLPDDEEVRDLVRACGGALTATSANPSGRLPAQTAEEVNSYFGNAIDLIIDGGKARSLQPSSVVDVTGDEPLLIREGVISSAQLDSAVRNMDSQLRLKGI